MTSSSAVKKARPLSPHLQVYRPQITSVLSILHRITGVGLSLALPVFVWFLVALSQGQEAYQTFVACAHSLIGQIVLIGWIWAFCYHLCSGIRHLFWDNLKLFEIKQVYASGWATIVLSTALTAGVWYVMMWCKNAQ